MNKGLYLSALLAVISPAAQSGIVYLPGEEVLDTNTNLIWLKPTATAGMGLNNVYTQNGWALSTIGAAVSVPDLRYGPYSLPSMITGNFPGETGGGAPYNPALRALFVILGARQFPGTTYVEMSGTNRTANGGVFGIGMGYADDNGISDFVIEGGEAIPPEDYIPNLDSKLWLYRSPRSGPVKWTIERRQPLGPDVAGTFVYNQDTQTVSNVRIRTSPSPYPETGDDYGILHQKGAIYTKVVTPWIDSDGRLEGMVLEGTPIGAPQLRAYYYLGFFIGGVGSECPLAAGCSGQQIPGQMVARVDATDAGEIVCAEGTVVGAPCVAGQSDPPVISYRINVGGAGSHQFVFPAIPSPVDTDSDGMMDAVDNCTLLPNPSQCDSDGDGYGNRCDGDLSNSGFTNAQDTTLYRQQLGQPSVPPTYNKADINCNGFVNSQDTTLYRQLLGLPPGPSGLVP